MRRQAPLLELDHVLVAVTDLAVAAREIERRHGLASVEGGRHPDWGTANRIVPLGSSFLELIAVVDEAAADSAFGRWVTASASALGRPIGWAVRADKLDDIARRLDLTPVDGSRVTPSGALLRWRNLGVDQAVAAPALPFFIEWAPGTRLPGTTAVTHRAGRAAISRLILDGDPGHLAAWLGPHTLPIDVRTGQPAVASVVLSTATGDIVIGADD